MTYKVGDFIRINNCFKYGKIIRVLEESCWIRHYCCKRKDCFNKSQCQANPTYRVNYNRALGKIKSNKIFDEIMLEEL